MTTIWAKAEALLKNDLNEIEDWFSGEAWPFLKTLFQTVEQDVVVTLKPFAEQAIAEVVKDAGVLLSGGGFSAAVASAVPALLTILENAGHAVETTAGADIMTALNAAAANAKAALGTSTGAQPQS